jgi:hypothetical protein
LKSGLLKIFKGLTLDAQGLMLAPTFAQPQQKEALHLHALSSSGKALPVVDPHNMRDSPKHYLIPEHNNDEQ